MLNKVKNLWVALLAAPGDLHYKRNRRNLQSRSLRAVRQFVPDPGENVLVAAGVVDPFDLQRFVAAQDGVYASVLDELRGGRKKTHWMWFVFPQIRGLGSSAMAQRYAITSLAEARAFAEHALLGPRLRECAGLVLGHPHRSVADIFGFPDDRKFHSSMTLFSKAVAGDELFARALVQCFDSKDDDQTIALIQCGPTSQRPTP